MNSKLTLNLDKSVIKRAKGYAKNSGTSLSKLIENYLNALTSEDDNEKSVTPLVQSLTGIIPEQTDKKSKADYYDHLTKKYS